MAGTAAVSTTCLVSSYLTGSFGWFLFYMLHKFSISLSPPPSADENDGFMKVPTEGPFPFYSEPVISDTELGCRPESLLPHCRETRHGGEGESLGFLFDGRRHSGSEAESPSTAQDTLSS